MNNQIDSLDAIKKLGELKELGLVTEEEFQEKKALIFLRDKYEVLAATENRAVVSAEIKSLTKVESEKSTTTQSAIGSPDRLKKIGEVQNIEATATLDANNSSLYLQNRRRFENTEAATTPNATTSPHKLQKKGGFKNKEAAAIPSATRSRHKLKKRRKIDNTKETITPASSLGKLKKKNINFSPLFVSLSILVAVCFGSAIWLF